MALAASKWQDLEALSAGDIRRLLTREGVSWVAQGVAVDVLMKWGSFCHIGSIGECNLLMYIFYIN